MSCFLSLIGFEVRKTLRFKTFLICCSIPLIYSLIFFLFLSLYAQTEDYLPVEAIEKAMEFNARNEEAFGQESSLEKGDADPALPQGIFDKIKTDHALEYDEIAELITFLEESGSNPRQLPYLRALADNAKDSSNSVIVPYSFEKAPALLKLKTLLVQSDAVIFLIPAILLASLSLLGFGGPGFLLYRSILPCSNLSYIAARLLTITLAAVLVSILPVIVVVLIGMFPSLNLGLTFPSLSLLANNSDGLSTLGKGFIFLLYQLAALATFITGLYSLCSCFTRKAALGILFGLGAAKLLTTLSINSYADVPLVHKIVWLLQSLLPDVAFTGSLKLSSLEMEAVQALWYAPLVFIALGLLCMMLCILISNFKEPSYA